MLILKLIVNQVIADYVGDSASDIDQEGIQEIITRSLAIAQDHDSLVLAQNVEQRMMEMLKPQEITRRFKEHQQAECCDDGLSDSSSRTFG